MSNSPSDKIEESLNEHGVEMDEKQLDVDPEKRYSVGDVFDLDDFFGRLSDKTAIPIDDLRRTFLVRFDGAPYVEGTQLIDYAKTMTQEEMKESKRIDDKGFYVSSVEAISDLLNESGRPDLVSDVQTVLTHEQIVEFGERLDAGDVRPREIVEALVVGKSECRVDDNGPSCDDVSPAEEAAPAKRRKTQGSGSDWYKTSQFTTKKSDLVRPLHYPTVIATGGGISEGYESGGSESLEDYKAEIIDEFTSYIKKNKKEVTSKKYVKYLDDSLFDLVHNSASNVLKTDVNSEDLEKVFSKEDLRGLYKEALDEFIDEPWIDPAGGKHPGHGGGYDPAKMYEGKLNENDSASTFDQLKSKEPQLVAMYKDHVGNMKSHWDLDKYLGGEEHFTTAFEKIGKSLGSVASDPEEEKILSYLEDLLNNVLKTRPDLQESTVNENFDVNVGGEGKPIVTNVTFKTRNKNTGALTFRVDLTPTEDGYSISFTPSLPDPLGRKLAIEKLEKKFGIKIMNEPVSTMTHGGGKPEEMKSYRGRPLPKK